MQSDKKNSNVREAERSRRNPVQLKVNISKRLAAYAVAADGRTESRQTDIERRKLAWSNIAAVGTAGLGMLLMAQPSSADIIYTPAHVGIHPGGSFPININHDGINDFRLFDKPLVFTYGTLSVKGRPPGNDFLISGSSGFTYVTPLKSGAVIGKSARFGFGNDGLLQRNCGTACTRRGLWGGVDKGYLGLEFEINGQEHFGWVRLEDVSGFFPYYALLTGYAYNTVAGQQILAGQTREPDGELTTATPEPGTLGLLALGSLGLAYWRRKKAEA